MGENILIVEDQFIEANDLRTILENAGHHVTGIARSVLQANEFIEAAIPNIVLIDIFLKGKLTGIDLAKSLTKQNIPFIYLSANSNQSTLEEAKATRPYGFLVKPFREKDILIALEIAIYRYRHQQEVVTRQEKSISGWLSNIIAKDAEPAEKLLQLAKTLQPFIHFDYIFFDTNLHSKGHESIIGFNRISYDNYKLIDIAAQDPLIPHADLHALKKAVIAHPRIMYHNDDEFTEWRQHSRISQHVHEVYQAQSEMIVPIVSGKQVTGAIFLYSMDTDCFNDEQMKLLAPMNTMLAAIFQHIQEAIIRDHKKINTDPENEQGASFSGIIGASPKLLHALDQVTQVAPYETTVLILGETGSGKEGLVDAIHQRSPRKNHPLIKINCAAIPENMVESELFGHERGAFTGATDRRIGKFEQAHGGTIFLDEIGEIPLDIQSKLLRVLQEKEIERLGGRQTIKTDVRIIAATNRNLHKEVANGNFRMDLFYRINVFPITLPPLRERKEDIPLLAAHFLQMNATDAGTDAKTITPDVMQKLLDYSWPGNIRELQHLIERTVILTNEKIITRIDLPEEPAYEMPVMEKAPLQSIEEVEKAHIMAAIKSCNGKISGKGGAAEILRIPVTTLRFKMKKLGIWWQYTTD